MRQTELGETGSKMLVGGIILHFSGSRLKAGELSDGRARGFDCVRHIPEVDLRGLDDRLVHWFRR